MAPGELAAFYAYRFFAGLARALPERLALGAGSFIGARMVRALPSRRRVVARNLQRVHGGEIEADELERLVRAAFASYGRYWWASFRLAEYSVAQLDERLSYEGLEHLEAARAVGNGVIMALPHLGSWDFGGVWMTTHGHPTTVVVEPAESPELFDWFASYRRRLGLVVVPLGRGAVHTLLRALRRNEVVGLVCDRDITGEGVEVELFGERTRLPGGPAALALRTGAPILPTAVYFDGPRDYHGVIGPPVTAPRTGRRRDDLAALTQALAAEMEVLIRRAPDQWHVFQPNWPSDRAEDGR